MGTTLTGTTPQDTYDSLIKVTDNGPLSGTAKYLSDGLGNDSKLALSTGNIGIGTTSPAALLTLQDGNVDNVSGSKLRMVMGPNPYWEIQANNGGVAADRKFVINTSAAGGDVLTLTQAGNVGIGTSSPNVQLEVSAADNSLGGILRLNNNRNALFDGDQNGSIQFSNNEATAGASGVRSEITSLLRDVSGKTDVVFTTAGSGVAATEKLRILADGGITFNGDTAAANALDDYEEGTFAPAPVGVANVSNFASVTGKYTKIGNVVNFNISFLADVASSTAESVVEITLPFGSYSTANKSVGHVTIFSGTGADRFGVGSLFLGTASNSIVNIYIAANQMNASGTGIEFRASYTYFV